MSDQTAQYERDRRHQGGAIMANYRNLCLELAYACITQDDRARFVAIQRLFDSLKAEHAPCEQPRVVGFTPLESRAVTDQLHVYDVDAPAIDLAPKTRLFTCETCKTSFHAAGGGRYKFCVDCRAARANGAAAAAPSAAATPAAQRKPTPAEAEDEAYQLAINELDAGCKISDAFVSSIASNTGLTFSGAERVVGRAINFVAERDPSVAATEGKA